MRKGKIVFDLLNSFLIWSNLDKFIARLTRGRLPESFLGKLAPNNYQYSKGTIRKTQLKNKYQFHVDLSDYIGHYIYYGFSDPYQDELINLVKEGYFVLYIGTNIGYTALLFADKVKSKGMVVGFEPDPDTYKLCINNIQLNKRENIHVYNFGLGDKKSSFFITDSGFNSGGNRIDENLTHGSKKVDVKKLDDFFLEYNYTKADLIKIDVEAYELKVLLGAKNIIQSQKPLLFIELDDNHLREQKTSAKELVSFLSENNYKVVEAVSKVEINVSYNFNNCHFDIICFPSNPEKFNNH